MPMPAPLSAKLLKNGTLKTYKGFPHGMPTTEADTINADLLAFIKVNAGKAPTVCRGNHRSIAMTVHSTIACYRVAVSALRRAGCGLLRPRPGGWLSPSQAYAEARSIVDLIRDEAAKTLIKVHKLRGNVSILEGSAATSRS